MVWYSVVFAVVWYGVVASSLMFFTSSLLNFGNQACGFTELADKVGSMKGEEHQRGGGEAGVEE